MSKNRNLIILLSALAILAIFNPSEASHENAVEKKAENIFGQELMDSLKNDFVASFKQTAGAEGVEQIKRMFGPYSLELASEYLNAGRPAYLKLVKRRNYLLFSLTEISLANHSQTIGIGVLGNVYLFL